MDAQSCHDRSHNTGSTQQEEENTEDHVQEKNISNENEEPEESIDTVNLQHSNTYRQHVDRDERDGESDGDESSSDYRNFLQINKSQAVHIDTFNVSEDYEVLETESNYDLTDDIKSTGEAVTNPKVLLDKMGQPSTTIPSGPYAGQYYDYKQLKARLQLPKPQTEGTQGNIPQVDGPPDQRRETKSTKSNATTISVHGPAYTIQQMTAFANQLEDQPKPKKKEKQQQPLQRPKTQQPQPIHGEQRQDARAGPTGRMATPWGRQHILRNNQRRLYVFTCNQRKAIITVHRPALTNNDAYKRVGDNWIEIPTTGMALQDDIKEKASLQTKRNINQLATVTGQAYGPDWRIVDNAGVTGTVVDYNGNKLTSHASCIALYFTQSWRGEVMAKYGSVCDGYGRYAKNNETCCEKMARIAFDVKAIEPKYIIFGLRYALETQIKNYIPKIANDGKINRRMSWSPNFESYVLFGDSANIGYCSLLRDITLTTFATAPYRRQTRFQGNLGQALVKSIENTKHPDFKQTWMQLDSVFEAFKEEIEDVLKNYRVIIRFIRDLIMNIIENAPIMPSTPGQGHNLQYRFTDVSDVKRDVVSEMFRDDGWRKYKDIKLYFRQEKNELVIICIQ